MITREAVNEQLNKIGFKAHGWGKTEVKELPHIILPDEEIKECVNGIYEGGFALLVATNIRVLLVDKKPLNYLTVEDLRFDMINEIDYSHRLFGARINISTGSKTLKFTSFNQPRLRELIGHVQHCMAESKIKQSEHQEDQNLHLEQINQQLQTYLLAQHRQQEKLQQQIHQSNARQQVPAQVEEIKPGNQLSDYLYAQSLLTQYQADSGQPVVPPHSSVAAAQTSSSAAQPVRPGSNDLYAEGMREVFGDKQPAQTSVVRQNPPVAPQSDVGTVPSLQQLASSAVHYALEINPLKIAYSKLPMAMRNRKFGRPSFHAHSQVEEPDLEPDSMVPNPQTDIAPNYY